MGKSLLLTIILGSILLATNFSSAASQSREDNLAISLEINKEKDPFWTQDVDKNTDWGKWLISTVQPYEEKLEEIIRISHFKMQETDINLSPDEMAMQARSGMINLSKAIENIIPPAELKAYHLKQVEIFAVVTKPAPRELVQDKEYTNKLIELNTEAYKELVRVFMEHGVPQEVTDVFTKKFCILYINSQ